MKRTVEAELLDELPAHDQRAIQARRDLQKVNAWMGHVRILAGVLRKAFPDRAPTSIVELGAGDGTLLLRLARTMASRWGSVHAVLVDRQRLLTPQTQEAFEALSWRVEAVQTDVFDWLQRPHAERSDIVISTLFLHHFTKDDLRRLLRGVAAQTDAFVACEPRRRRMSLRAVGLLWIIGCNDVTTHDARISVQAGFADDDLSRLWPVDHQWQVRERPAGGFTHCFWARRIGEGQS